MSAEPGLTPHHWNIAIPTGTSYIGHHVSLHSQQPEPLHNETRALEPKTLAGTAYPSFQRERSK